MTLKAFVNIVTTPGLGIHRVSRTAEQRRDDLAELRGGRHQAGRAAGLASYLHSALTQDHAGQARQGTAVRASRVDIVIALGVAGLLTQACARRPER